MQPFTLFSSLLVLLGSPGVAAQLPAPARRPLPPLTVAGCSLPNHDIAAAWQSALDLGYDGIEIAVFPEKETGPDRYPWVVVDRLDTAERQRLKALAAKFRHVTTHLPYSPDLRPLAADPVVREKSRRELHRALDDSAFWGAQLANVHVVSEPGVSFADAKADLVALYRELGEHAARSGMKLSIETTRPYRVAEYLELIRDIDRPNVGGTVDTGHISFYKLDLPVAAPDRASPESIRRLNDLMLEIVAALGPKLFHLHVDDVRAPDWREHFVPGRGIVDWPRLMAHLAHTGYRGVMVAEILYYEGDADTGRMLTRAFTTRTREGAAVEGLREIKTFFASSASTLSSK